MPPTPPVPPESPHAPASAPTHLPPDAGSAPEPAEPVLCGHCGRTASNGLRCQGYCVADSGY